ncbi:hypothetical protein BaRGS_00015866 [Batillaria attramentaria]|uniref:Uncharacterized protein n=1 Tax=Batillaria attramentaria TaxID=370345 RepID=A0ABD0L0G8_9CAEN
MGGKRLAGDKSAAINVARRLAAPGYRPNRTTGRHAVLMAWTLRLGARAAHTINALSGMTKKRVEMSGCSGDNSAIDRAILSLQHFTESDLPATAKHVENNVERGQLPAHIL